jgi:murein DD-endopeptidase MepM/ murein hydrolase activator NlpD
VPAAAIAAGPAADRGAAAASGRTLLERIYDPLEQAADRAGPRADRLSGPFHPVRGRVGYGDAEAAFGNARGRAHEGQDIFAAAGTPVIAPADGLVVDGGSDGGRGNWLAIYDPQRQLTYSYFHLLAAAAAGGGKPVEAGQTVGRVGCSGSCWGDHLHFEIRRGRGPYGPAIDPMPQLERWQQLRR